MAKPIAVKFDVLNSNNPTLCRGVAETHMRNGEYQQAIKLLTHAIELQPDDVDFHHRLGVAYYSIGDLDAAIAAYRRVIELQPDVPQTHNNLGVVLMEQESYPEAIASLERAVELQADYAEAWRNMGETWLKMKRYAQAADALKRAIAIQPDYPEALTALGKAYLELDDYVRAQEVLERAHQLEPDLLRTNVLLGRAYLEQSAYDEALASYQHAVHLDNTLAEPFNGIGIIWHKQGDYALASEYFREAIALQPDFAEAHLNLSYAVLLQGELTEGWHEYEWRLQTNQVKDLVASMNIARWHGESLAGKRLLVSSEQGIGDEIMFAGLYEELGELAESVTISCDKRLIPLFERSLHNITFIDKKVTRQQDVNNFDYKISAASLMQYLRQDMREFPEREAYLFCDEEAVERWRQRYEALPNELSVGISWRGGGKLYTKQVRSIDLNDWAPILKSSRVNCINLQYGDCADELKSVSESLGVPIYDWDDVDPMKDLDGFAAKVAALDLVISIDNSTVHMAGAVGTPVWTLLPFVPDWRWFLGTDATVWYSCMELIRQPRPEDWNSVLQQVEKALC